MDDASRSITAPMCDFSGHESKNSAVTLNRCRSTAAFRRENHIVSVGRGRSCRIHDVIETEPFVHQQGQRSLQAAFADKAVPDALSSMTKRTLWAWESSPFRAKYSNPSTSIFRPIASVSQCASMMLSSVTTGTSAIAPRPVPQPPTSRHDPAAKTVPLSRSARAFRARRRRRAC